MIQISGQLGKIFLGCKTITMTKNTENNGKWKQKLRNITNLETFQILKHFKS